MIMDRSEPRYRTIDYTHWRDCSRRWFKRTWSNRIEKDFRCAPEASEEVALQWNAKSGLSNTFVVCFEMCRFFGVFLVWCLYALGVTTDHMFICDFHIFCEL